MNKDDLKRMAREAGIDCLNGWLNDTPMQYYEAWPEQLERFFQAAYNAGVEAERERIKQANAPEIERINAYIKDAPDYKMGYADGVAAEQKKWEDQTAVEIHEAVLEEREASAKVCDEFAEAKHAAAIRARGQS